MGAAVRHSYFIYVHNIYIEGSGKELSLDLNWVSKEVLSMLENRIWKYMVSGISYHLFGALQVKYIFMNGNSMLLLI